MTAAACSDDEFVRLFEQGGASYVARTLGIAERAVYARRALLEKKLRRALKSPNTQHAQRRSSNYDLRQGYALLNGHALIASDVHCWPGPFSVAKRGFIHMVRELKPKLTLLNGDVFDGARVKRHPPIGWERLPTVVEELDACTEFTDAVRAAAKGSDLYWTLGNHDMRYESVLAAKAPEYQGTKFAALSDHFPHWRFTWSLWVNNDVVIKHRFKGGIHATHNNTLWAGKTMVTGHLHSLKVTPLSDYNGTRFGVDTGTLDDPYGEHANYTEDNPLNHRSGFIVLTFRNGVLLWPEIAAVVDEEHIQFRGQLIKV